MALMLEVDALSREAPLHGLVPSAREVTPSDPHWEAGIAWKAVEGCEPILTWDATCGEAIDKDLPGTNTGAQSFLPFVVYTSVECQVTPRNLDGMKAIVVDRLKAGTSKAIEAEFWSGSLLSATDNFSLVNSTPNVSGGGATACTGILNQSATSAPVAVSPEVALISLSQALANCGVGARGHIHAPVYLGETWGLRNYLDCYSEADEEYLVTRGRGDIVVVGSGYDGSGPTGNPSATPTAGTSWAYATGPVGVLLGEPFFPAEDDFDVVDRATNTVRIIAERFAAILVDPGCVFAILVDVP